MAITFALPNFGMGCAPLGGDGGVFGMASDAAADATVQHALAHGVTFFDTAPLYGSGVSETRLGRALAGAPRDQYQIATKIGVVINADGSTTRSYRRDAVKRSVEDSLRRLNVDHVEIAHIHDADPEINLRIALDEAYPVLADFKAQGVIRAIGAGMNYWEPEAEMARNADFDCFLLAGRYTLLEQEPLDELLPLCEKRGAAVVIGGGLNSGILATGAVPGAKYNYAPAPEHIMEKVRKIEAVCAAHKVPLPAAALQFLLAHPAVASHVPGTRTVEQMEQNIGWISHPIPTDFWAELKHKGLLRQDAPVPT